MPVCYNLNPSLWILPCFIFIELNFYFRSYQLLLSRHSDIFILVSGIDLIFWISQISRRTQVAPNHRKRLKVPKAKEIIRVSCLQKNLFLRMIKLMRKNKLILSLCFKVESVVLTCYDANNCWERNAFISMHLIMGFSSLNIKWQYLGYWILITKKVVLVLNHRSLRLRQSFMQACHFLYGKISWSQNLVLCLCSSTLCIFRYPNFRIFKLKILLFQHSFSDPLTF